jgi:hypothetical protein
VNCYLIALYSDIEGDRLIKFRSQDDFRMQLVEALLDLGKAALDGEVPRKRSFAHMNAEAYEVPVHRHEHIKLATRKNCACCKGVRYGDNPSKRAALAEVAANRGRDSTRRTSYWGCKQCNVALCKHGQCFSRYHQNH